MVWVEIGVIFLGILSVIGALIWQYKMKIKGSKIDLLPNAPIIRLDARRKFTDGYVEGFVKSAVPAKNDCVTIEFVPIDYEQGEDKPLPEVQTIVVHRASLRPMARLENSSRREIIETTSRNPTDIPNAIRDTEKGEWHKKESQHAWLEKTFGEAIAHGDEAIADAMGTYSRGNISRAAFAQMKEEQNMKTTIQGSTIVEEKKDDKS